MTLGTTNRLRRISPLLSRNCSDMPALCGVPAWAGYCSELIPGDATACIYSSPTIRTELFWGANYGSGKLFARLGQHVVNDLIIVTAPAAKQDESRG